MIIVQGDGTTQVAQQFPHGGDVADVGNVGQGVLTGGQQTCRHLLQYGIFGPEGRHLTVQRSRGGDSELCHPLSIADSALNGTNTYLWSRGSPVYGREEVRLSANLKKNATK